MVRFIHTKKEKDHGLASNQYLVHVRGCSSSWLQYPLCAKGTEKERKTDDWKSETNNSLPKSEVLNTPLRIGFSSVLMQYTDCKAILAWYDYTVGNGESNFKALVLCKNAF